MSRRKFYTTLFIAILTIGVYLCGCYNQLVTSWFLSKDNYIGLLSVTVFLLSIWIFVLFDKIKGYRKRIYDTEDNIERLFIELRSEIKSLKLKARK